MSVVAKSRPKPKSDEPETEKESWHVFARLDPSLKPIVDDYINSREYPPHLARVIEKALRLLMEKEGFWPPAQDK